MSFVSSLQSVHNKGMKICKLFNIKISIYQRRTIKYTEIKKRKAKKFKTWKAWKGISTRKENRFDTNNRTLLLF